MEHLWIKKRFFFCGFEIANFVPACADVLADIFSYEWNIEAMCSS